MICREAEADKYDTLLIEVYWMQRLEINIGTL